MTERRVAIAAPEGLNTVPLIYGIEHADCLHADVVCSSPSHSAAAFAAGRADIALLPVGELPGIKDADIVSSYCVGYIQKAGVCLLAGHRPIEKIERIFHTPDTLTEGYYAAILATKKRGARASIECADVLPAAADMAESDACVFAGEGAEAAAAGFSHVYDLTELWNAVERGSMVYAVWVAHSGVGNATLDALEQSLTFGLEHVWEAICSSAYAERPDAYDFLICKTDYIFDNQKNKALKKFWDSGLKTTLRINPG